MDPSTQLLFLDSFVHNKLDEHQVDLVRFPAGKSFIIRELRIIPGQVSVKFPTGSAVGSTTPPSFLLEIFASGTEDPTKGAFIKLGNLNYSASGESRFLPEREIPCDGVLLRGPYTTLTVALLGRETRFNGNTPVHKLPASISSSSGPSTSTQPSKSSSSFAIQKPHQPVSLTLNPPTRLAKMPLPSAMSRTSGGAPIPTIGSHATGSPQSMRMNQPQPQQAQTASPLIPAHFDPSVPPPSGLAPHPIPQPAPVLMSFDPTRPPPNLGGPPPSGQIPPPQQQQQSPQIPIISPVPESFQPHQSPPSYSSTPPLAPPGVGKPESEKKREPIYFRKPISSREHRESEGSSGSRERTHSEKGEDHHHYSGSEGRGKRGWRDRGEERERGSGLKREPMSPTPPTTSAPDSPPANPMDTSDGVTEKELEAISDEEFDFEETNGDLELTNADQELLERATTRFAPSEIDLYTKLGHFREPWLSACERLKVENANSKNDLVDNTDSEEELWRILENLTADYGSGYETRCESWVLEMERVLQNLQKSLASLLGDAVPDATQAKILEALISWTVYGLDVNEAMQQVKPEMIIRHLKVGIRLTTLLATSHELVAELLVQAEAQHLIMDLIGRDHMTIPMKLALLKALDGTLFFDVGMDALLNQESPIWENGPLLTPYQRLCRCLEEKQSCRFLVAGKCILRRVSVYEAIQSLSNIARKLCDYEDQRNDEDGIKTEEKEESAELSDDDIRSLTDTFSLIRLVLEDPRNSLVISTGLPVSKRFTPAPISEDPYPGIYRMMLSNCFLESLVVVCSQCRNRLSSLVHQVLEILLSRMEGLLFLAFQPEASQILLETLIDQSQDHLEDEPPGYFHKIGLDICHHLHGLHQIDRITVSQKTESTMEIDSEEILGAFHQLYRLSFTPLGRRAIVRLLSWDSNASILFRYLKLSGDSEIDAKMRKSACTGYASELLLMTLRCSESVTFLQQHHEDLLVISAQERTSKTVEVRGWVEVLRKLPSFDRDAVEYLCEKVKTIVMDNGNPRIPSDLLTVLRILHHIVVPSESPIKEAPKELDYRSAMIQMFSLDTISSLVRLLTKLTDSQVINWQQGLSLQNREGSLFYGCALPALRIIRHTLTELIVARGNDFRDTTAVRPLLRLYSICCSMLPATASGSVETVQIQKDVIEALLSFTRTTPANAPSVEISQEDDELVLTRSRDIPLWTKMLREVLSFVLESPSTFVGGVAALSELLPLPFPLATVQPLSDEEVELGLGTREAWSIHLLPLETELAEMIGTLVLSTHAALQTSLRRLCLQLTDLTAQVSQVVVRAVLDVVLGLLVEEGGLKKEEGTGMESGAELAHILNVLAYLSSQAPFKMTMLSIINDKSEGNEKYGTLLPKLLSVFNHISSKTNHAMYQESVVSFLASLCDYEVSLIAHEKHEDRLNKVQYSLPAQSQLEEICLALLAHIGNVNHGYASVIPALRILLLLAEHDYGFLHLRRTLKKEEDAVLNLLRRILTEFSGQSSDCMSTLSIAIDLIKVMQQAPSEGSLRTKVLGGSLMRSILNWKYGGRDKNPDHPVVKLEDLLQKGITEENGFQTYLDSMEEITSCLDGDEPAGPEEELDLLPVIQIPDLNTRFQKRLVWILCDDLEEEQFRLTPHYWFPSCALEDIADEGDIGEVVGCDLEKLRQEFLPQFDPKEELLKLVSAKNVERKRKAVPAMIDTSRGEKNNMGPTPIRGRGFQPGNRGRHPGGRGIHDHFRNRPQNTSRAPSMHVDDFIAMESEVKDQDPPKGRDRGGDWNRPGQKNTGGQGPLRMNPPGKPRGGGGPPGIRRDDGRGPPDKMGYGRPRRDQRYRPDPPGRNRRLMHPPPPPRNRNPRP